MNSYVLGVRNWKSGSVFFIRKNFYSAYHADRYAMRISFSAKNSPYLVWLVPCDEV